MCISSQQRHALTVLGKEEQGFVVGCPAQSAAHWRISNMQMFGQATVL